MEFLKKIKRNLRPFITFCLIGGINTLIHIVTLYSLVEFANFYYILASFIGFILAVTNSFILNTIFTFKQKLNYQTKKRYSKFFTISASSAIINLSLLYLITEYLGIYYLISQLIATLFSLTINFIANKKWTYKN